MVKPSSTRCARSTCGATGAALAASRPLDRPLVPAWDLEESKPVDGAGVPLPLITDALDERRELASSGSAAPRPTNVDGWPSDVLGAHICTVPSASADPRMMHVDSSRIHSIAASVVLFFFRASATMSELKPMANNFVACKLVGTASGRGAGDGDGGRGGMDIEPSSSQGPGDGTASLGAVLALSPARAAPNFVARNCAACSINHCGLAPLCPPLKTMSLRSFPPQAS
mmetsp:Transcript_11199/g.30987  ORF Transcript_11199/g.30987 Transcript_11199/m.30987 type:complete len:228 (+) Transcript_11199:344-1027(+)